MRSATRTRSFYYLAAVFTAVIIFLYGPMAIIVLLSFQGPEGGLTFPMNGISVFWFERLWEGVGVIDIWRAFRRSVGLGLVVMLSTVVFSLAAGLAFRQRFFGASTPYYSRRSTEKAIYFVPNSPRVMRPAGWRASP